MMRRCLVALLLLAVSAPSPVLAQSGGGGNPFGPLPQTPQAPPEAPEPKKIEAPEDDDGLGGTSFWLIIGTTAAIFATVAFLITRDMRRTVGKRGRKQRRLRGTGRPAQDAANAVAGSGRHEPGSHKARAKAQQRAKTKAARKQRRKSRSR
jgi:predicted lipid-binding transport protein (Tim44 family)